MIKKNQFIKDLKKDEVVNDIFAVKFKKPVDKYAKGYKFELRLCDSSKEIMYKYWGGSDEAKVTALYESIKKDDVVHIQAKVGEWNNTLELSANEGHALKVLGKGEYDLRDFIKASEKNVSVMWKEFTGYIASVKDEDMKKVLDCVFSGDFVSKFKESPAAMYIHHGWIHGLLEHTLSVVKICESVLGLHKMDRDLVITGALLHDIGKVEEFAMTTNISITREGVLLGHTEIGCEMLSKAMDQLNTPKLLRTKLIHIILAHMGEFGSKTPQFPEAMCVYMADEIDAKLCHMIRIKDEANTEDDYVYTKDFGNVFLG